MGQQVTRARTLVARTLGLVRDHWKPVAAILVVSGLFVVGRLLEIHQYLQHLQEAVAGLGALAPVAYGLIFVIATLLFLPGTPFTVIAALLFEPWLAFLVMVAATTVTAILAFVIARYFARSALEERLAGVEIVDRLTGLAEDNYRTTIPFMRVLPFFPFAVNNYALGLTRIPFWSYLLYSEIVFIPMNAVLVFGARALYRMAVRGETAWPLLAITTAAGLLLVALRRMAGRRMEAAG